MAHRRSFYLYRRHKKGGDYWYVCFLDKDTGRQMTAKSIDCLKERMGIMDFHHITRKEDAAVIANKALESGLVFSDGRNILFSSWCIDFWTWEKSEYIALRNNLNKDSIGKEYAYNMLKNFQKNVLPLIPKGLKLVNVNARILDRISKELYKTGKASGTVKVITYSFSIPLKEAHRLGYITENPADKLLFSNGEEKDRGVLSKEEIDKIVKYLEDNRKSIFPSYRLAILLALSTGMRLSEVRAVNISDFVDCQMEGYVKLLIRHSLGYLSGVKGTKGKYDRSVLVDKEFAEEIMSNADKCGIAFPSPREEYMSAPTLRMVFYDVLHAIGITERERVERNITFHSLRHSFSTLSRDHLISQEDRMLVLGHKSVRINDRYTHSTDEALKRVAEISLELLYGKETKSAEKGAEYEGNSGIGEYLRVKLSAMQKHNIRFIHNTFDVIYLIFGPAIAAVGIALFYTPAKITSGGASGVANILYNLFGFDIGLVTFCVNLPLILVGVFVFGVKYSLKTFIGSTLLSFWVSTFGHITGYTGFLDVSEPVNILLSAIFGGVLLGSGIGITMKSGCNTGGTDIVAQTIAHYTPIAVGTVSFCFNGVVVGASGYFIGFQPMLFSIIGMFCSSFMVNYVLTGIGTRRSKTVYVISDDIETIGYRVVHELKRSGTVWEAKGFYTGKNHKILMVLVQNHQYQRLLRIINQEDPSAFVYVGEAYRVLGKGFVPLRKIADTTVAED